MFLRGGRKLRNFLLEPHLQFMRGFYFVTFFLCMLGMLYFWVHVQVVIAVEFMSAEAGLVAVNAIDFFNALSIYTVVAYFLTGFVFSFLFGIHSSHKVVGPSVAIRQHIDRLIENDFSKDLQIRSGDELLTVEAAINELTKVLREKNSQK